MSWYISPDINNGYPYNTEFPTNFSVDWTVNDNVQLPKIAWRIKSGVNDGYPYIWYWFKESDTPSDGTMDIGGRQTNYPNGFSSVANSQISFDGNGQQFNSNPSIGTFIANLLTLYSCTPSGITETIDAYRDYADSVTGTVAEKIAQLFGGNFLDSIIISKIFPFDIPSSSSAVETIPVCAGLITIKNDPLSPLPYYPILNTSVLLDFGYINLNITQGWEIETIDWSIYLPYCGEFPIDIRSNEGLQLYCLVDLVSGNCEYYLLLKKYPEHSGDIIFSTSGKMGIDLPITLNSAKLANNMQGWKNTVLGKGLELGGSLLSAAYPGVGTVVGGLMSGAGNMMEKTQTHHTLTAPSLGGGLCLGAPQKARIIGRRPTIQYNAFGYPQLIGLKYKYMVEKISDLNIGDYSEFENYKCDIIVATTEEKAEIESLMNKGVFI